MIPGVKQVNLTSVVQSVRENEPVKQAAGQNKTQSSANLQRAAILTGSLAGLAVLGYAGVKAFRGKAPDIKTAEALPEIIYENLPPQAVIKCREWLEHIRDLPAHVWKVDENKCCTVPNPDSKRILFEFFNRLKPEEEKAFAFFLAFQIDFREFIVFGENRRQVFFSEAVRRVFKHYRFYGQNIEAFVRHAQYVFGKVHIAVGESAAQIIIFAVAGSYQFFEILDYFIIRAVAADIRTHIVMNFLAAVETEHQTDVVVIEPFYVVVV